MRRSNWMEGNRGHFAATFDMVGTMIVQAEEILKSAPILTDQKSLATALLFKRVLSGSEAMTILVSYGFSTQARVQHRSVIEALLKLGAICEDLSAYNDFVAQQGISKRTQAQDMLRLREAAHLAENEEPTVAQITGLLNLAIDELSRYATNANVKSIRKMESYDWATRANLTRFFWGHYARRSDTTHHSILDLSRDLVRNTDNVAVGINLGPDNEDPTELLTDAGEAVRIAVEKLQKLVSFELPAGYLASADNLQKARIQMASAKRAARSAKTRQPT